MEVNEDRDETGAWGKEEGNKGPGSAEDTDLLRGRPLCSLKFQEKSCHRWQIGRRG